VALIHASLNLGAVPRGSNGSEGSNVGEAYGSRHERRGINAVCILRKMKSSISRHFNRSDKRNSNVEARKFVYLRVFHGENVEICRNTIQS